MSHPRIRFVVSCSAIGILCLLASGTLFGQQVRTNYMPGTDFGKYKTYRWTAVEGGGVHPNQIVDAEIKQAIDKQLAEKGFTKTDDPKANLAVTYQVAVDRERQWTGMGMGGGLRLGGMATATSNTISVGTLVLDFYDAGAKQLVWQGQATKALDPGGNQEKNQKNLDKAMKKLLKDFPPNKK